MPTKMLMRDQQQQDGLEPACSVWAPRLAIPTMRDRTGCDAGFVGDRLRRPSSCVTWWYTESTPFGEKMCAEADDRPGR